MSYKSLKMPIHDDKQCTKRSLVMLKRIFSAQMHILKPKIRIQRVTGRWSLASLHMFRLNSGNFEILYPDEFYSNLKSFGSEISFENRFFNFCVGETVGEKSLGFFLYQFQAQNQNAKSQPVFDRWNLYMHVFYISCKLA